MNVTRVVLDYRNFLNASWDSFISFYRYSSKENLGESTFIEEITNDWLQANWEILVESSITGVNEFLENYGNGADCNGASGRVIYPDKSPTHRIYCKKNPNSICLNVFTGKEISEEELKVLSFVKFSALSEDGLWYKDMPPFDHILLSHPTEVDDVLIKSHEIIFDISSI